MSSLHQISSLCKISKFFTLSKTDSDLLLDTSGSAQKSYIFGFNLLNLKGPRVSSHDFTSLPQSIKCQRNGCLAGTLQTHARPLQACVGSDGKGDGEWTARKHTPRIFHTDVPLIRTTTPHRTRYLSSPFSISISTCWLSIFLPLVQSSFDASLQYIWIYASRREGD